jgi:hypothetical protein
MIFFIRYRLSESIAVEAKHARPSHVTPLKASLPVTVDPWHSRHGIHSYDGHYVDIARGKKNNGANISESRSTWQID